MDIVLVELARDDQLLDLGEGDLAGRRHHRIEVPGRAPIDEVALVIAQVGLDDGKIRLQAALHHIELAVEFADFLALRHQGADAGLGEERGDARPAGPDALSQGALRIELQLELAGEIELGEQLVLADIARNHLPDLAAGQKDPQAEVVHAAVVGNHGQVLHAHLADARDQVLGDAAEAEAARHDRHAVEQHARKRVSGVLHYLAGHAVLLRRNAAFENPPTSEFRLGR